MQEKKTLDDAVAIMRDLRTRDAWDKAQTHDSLRPYLNEEMHELDDALYYAIDEKDHSINLSDKGRELLAGSANDTDLFLLPDEGLKFAAMIPKGEYVTLCLLGTKITAETVTEFLAKPVVKKFLPESLEYTVGCCCLPKMNVGAPAVAKMSLWAIGTPVSGPPPPLATPGEAG